MTFQELQKYYDKHQISMTEILTKIEMKIILARDTKNIPIYMTRARVKNIESSYLKTKRKDKKEIMSITDLIGLRVLCLFEQDIFDVYSFLLEMCKSKLFILEEVSIFGLKKESILKVSSFDRELKKYKKYENIKINDEARDNGYQSIHFVGTYEDFDENVKYPFEIQLRTLLQDVWGELEHKLAYKQKNPHSFIKNSFIRLSKSLETNDMLITHLKDIIEESDCNKDKIPLSLGNVLKYEEERLPKAFKENVIICKKYLEYKELVYQDGFLRSKKMGEAKKIYRELVTLYYKEKSNEHQDINFNYWKEMEQAFFDIYSENFEDAKRTYYKYLEKKSYVSAYRLGQIYLYEDKQIEALKKFDICFSILDDTCLHINRMKLHVNMALIFWNLGSEYLTATINSIEKALESIEDNPNQYSKRDFETLYNSACWYYMECHFNGRCSKKVKSSNDKAANYYEKLVEIVSLWHDNDNVARKHTYDTLAWYNYKRYIESDKEDISFIKESYNYILLMNKGVMPIIQYYSHEAIQQSHLQKINCEYRKVFNSN